MTLKYALSFSVISIGVFGAIPTVVNAQQQGSDESMAQEDPEGLIVVKILPARDATSSEISDAPRRITDRRDPEYVRCRLEPVAGSYLKKRKICMTNHEWTLAIRKGNQYAREFVDDNQPGFMLQ
ncbi:MAG: hypothetical protein WBM39_00845 [Parasphingorhabdus sp.]